MEKMTRRKFLGTSGAVASGAAASTALGSGATSVAPALRTTGSGSPNGRIHVALIGSGGMGRGNLRSFLRVDEVECLAIADVDERHQAQGAELVSERRGRAPATVRDYRHILDRDDVDAVIVATPDHWHALPTIHACQAGKDVYVEKPLATSMHEGRVMLDAARKYDRVVQVGTQQRSAGHFQEVVDFVRSGQLGKIRLVRVWAYLDWKTGLGNPPDQHPPPEVDYDMWLGPAPKRPFNPVRFHWEFRWFWDYSGGLMTDWGAHMVDVAMWAMDEDPIAAMAIGGNYGYPDDIMETPDTQQSIVEFPSFSLIWEHMIGCGVGPWQREHGVQFHGENGILIADRNGWEVHSETNRVDRRDRVYKMTPVPRQPGSSDFHFAHVQDFLECVRSRKRPNADIGINHRSVNACHIGNVAMRLRRYVRWDARKEEFVGDSEAQRLAGREYRAPWKLPQV